MPLEQEPTEGTEPKAILCSLGFLLLNLETGKYRADAADFFSRISRTYWLHSEPRGRPSRHRVFRDSRMSEF